MDYFFQHLIEEFHRPLTNPVLVFSLILLIILLSPIVLRRLKIPGIIGLIISGVIIGPYGLNFLEKNSAVDLFSTIGLLYIMFIAGLELDLKEFKKHSMKSLFFGILTFVFPMAIGFPVLFHLMKYDFNTSLLTASMFATHTLVAYPIVSKFGISKNKAVAITIGGTILTDTAVLILLAVIMGSYDGGLSREFWIRLTTSLAIFLVIMFILIPRITKWFFNKLESEKTSHYIFVLAVVFFAAFLAEAAGVEPIIGAFISGLVLNRLIPPSSALMNRIEFIGNALFIPFFLISVGMIVNIGAITQGPYAIIIAIVLTIIALFGKWIAAFFTQVLFRFTRLERNLIFGLSSSRAAATLAVVLVGYKAGILDEDILNGTIILILITCLVASFVTEGTARRIRETSEAEPVAESEINAALNEHILLPVSKMTYLEKLLEFAILIKNKRSPHPISLIHVVPNDDEAESNIQIARKNLESVAPIAAASETQIKVMATIDYNIPSGIARASKEAMASLIILGWPGKATLLDRFIGDTTDSILNATDKDIFICSIDKPLISLKRIVIVCPPYAELERGFEIWFPKVARLAKELSLPVLCFSTVKSQEMMTRTAQSNIKISFDRTNEWYNVQELAAQIDPDDLLVWVSARKGSVSYSGHMVAIQEKLEKYLLATNRIMIFPQRYETSIYYEGYEDLYPEPLTRGIETIQKVGKGIGRLLGRR
jgi:Kef-type K+ transport system membrane component KefB